MGNVTDSSANEDGGTQAEDTRLNRRQEAVGRALRALIRDSYKQRFGPIPGMENWALEFKVQVDPQNNWALTFDPPLEEQLLPQMDQIQADHNVFQAGRVYCYRCESSECGHAQPESSLSVFQGYDEMGCPRWCELAQLLIDTRDERVDQLFGNSSKFITKLLDGSFLHTRQLTSFGRASKTYAVLGQVVCGYLRWWDNKLGPEVNRLALSMQAVELRDHRGRLDFELNLLCKPPHHLILAEITMEHFPWVTRAWKRGREALKNLAAQAETRRLGIEKRRERVMDILAKMAGELARGDRQFERQTHHARERRRILRPVDKAMSDLSRASRDHMFWDLKTKAVVFADKGRCHVFNEEGRHVTSFSISAGEVQHRLRKKRWCNLTAERYDAFIALFQPSPGGNAGG